MLEKLPRMVGEALEGVRPGLDATVSARLGPVAGTLRLTSPAFASDGALPVRCTADGSGTSPPLAWTGVPDGTAALALIVEDADSPTPKPLVHAIVLGLTPATSGLPEGAMVAEGQGAGRNSFGKTGWLPPDPPPGHGPHRYAFQLFALSRAPDPDGTPGRTAFVEAVSGHVLASSVLIGTFERA